MTYIATRWLLLRYDMTFVSPTQRFLPPALLRRTPPTRSTVKGMDFGARIGRFNKWMMLVVYPFYLYLVSFHFLFAAAPGVCLISALIYRSLHGRDEIGVIRVLAYF